MVPSQTGKLTMGYGTPERSMEKTAKLDLSYGPQGKLALKYQNEPLPSMPAPGKLALSFTAKGKLEVAYKNEGYPPAPGKLALSFTAKGKLAVAYKNDYQTTSTSSTALPKPGKLALSFTEKGKLAVGYKNDFPPPPGKLALSFTPTGKLAVAYKNDYIPPPNTATSAKLNLSRGPAGKLCLSYSKPLIYTQELISNVRQTFEAIDTKKNGNIELCDFANCFKVLKLEMNANEIEAVFNSYAINGRFGIEEFLQMVQEGLQYKAGAAGRSALVTHMSLRT
jgi:hypothetical protein